MSEWTKEQSSAINADSSGIIVSAAAGSGKTSVLVERLIRIISDTENKTPADRLVVVTFTNDAALQMKQRLSEALSKRIENEPDSEWLCSQQALLQTAKISTIHSFCFDMIRENIQSLDVSAGFRIMDDKEESLIRRNAAANTFEKFYAEKPKTMKKLCDFFSGTKAGDSELEEVLLELYNFLVSIPFYDDKMNEWENFYAAGFSENDPKIIALYEEYVKSAYEKFKNKAILLQNEYNQLMGERSAALENDKNTFESLINNISASGTWDKKFAVQSVVFADFERKKITDEKIKEKRKKIMDRRNNYKTDFKKFSENIFTSDMIKDDYKKHANILHSLFELVRCFDAELRSLKNEKNALGFSDAEQFAVTLLADKDDQGNIYKTKLAEELSEYYAVVMIDEFQDANNNQDLIFKMLSKGGTAERGGTNLFTVGDMKQSIYRFRLANPQLFKNALNIAEDYSENGDYKPNVKILLNKNFRSSRSVIDFVNFVFENLMTEKVGDVDYTSGEALVEGAKYPEDERDTEIIVISGISAKKAGSDNSPKDEVSDSDAEEKSLAEIEAAAAAERIRSMLGVKKVYEKKSERPCEPRDFCILARSRKNFEAYSKALAAAGIKAHAEEPEGYLRSREISALMSMLAVVDNPMQNIQLTAALMSPMFMLNAEDMAVISLVKKDEKKFFNKIKAIMAGETEGITVSDELHAKLDRFMKTFEKLRYCAASQKLERFIRTIYDSTDLLSTVQTYKDGNVKKANLRLLLEIADSYEKNSGGGISGFIRYADNMIRRGSDMSMASTVSAGENAVSIKTIHKSKGLEYPFIFLCGTYSEFNDTDMKKRIQINADYGIGLKIQERKKLRLYNSFPRLMISEINRKNSISEEMRLLYVALTRAKEQLFITVPLNDGVLKKIRSAYDNFTMPDGNEEAGSTAGNTSGGLSGNAGKKLSEKANAGSMLEWLAEVLFKADVNWLGDIEKISNGDETPKDKDMTIGSGKVNVRVFRPTGAEVTVPEKTDAKADSSKVEALKKLFAFKYDDERVIQSAKLTVTEVAKNSPEEEFILRRPDFSEESGLTAAERGTAAHTFMQYADYSKAEQDIIGEAHRLVDSGIMSSEEIDSLKIEQISGFFASELYSRMKNSGMIRREQKFLVRKSDISLDDSRLKEYNNDSMLQGTADCLFEENGEIVLVDYKTDRVRSPDELAERYDLQVKLYAAALTKIFGKRVKEAYLYSFALGKTVRIS